MAKKTVYIFDTSPFIALHQNSTRVIELPQAIWDELATMMSSGVIISHKYVYEEIVSEDTKNPDPITQWLLTKKAHFQSETAEQAIEVAAIIEKFPQLIRPEQEKEQADPWIIAQAIILDRQTNLLDAIEYVVVTQENQNSPKKIPAACKHFKIRCITLKDFFNETNIKIEKSN